VLIKKTGPFSDNTILGIVFLSFLIAETVLLIIGNDINIILTHLFYFPIIFLAYQWPKRGILISTGFGLVYILVGYFIHFEPLSLLTISMQFYVYVSVGIVVTFLSGKQKQNEMKYHSVFNNPGSAICLIEIFSGEIIEANEKCKKLLVKLGTQNPENFWHLWADEQNGNEFRNLIIRDNTITDYETEITGDNGLSYTMLISSGLILDNCAVVIITDITQRKNTEKELKIRNEELAVINEVISTVPLSGSLDKYLDDTLQNVVQLLNFEGGAIYLLDEDENTAYLKNLQGPEGEWQEEWNKYHGSLEIRQHPYDKVFTIQGPQYIQLNDYETIHSHELFSGENILTFGLRSGMKSFVAIPIYAENNLLGSMFIASGELHQFLETEKNLLTSIGKELGNAIKYNILQNKLEETNNEVNLYLDILTHDIGNTNTTMLGYAEILQDVLMGEEKGYVHKILLSVDQSRKIIRNVSTIRKIRETSPRLNSISLDEVIQAEAGHFPEANIHYEPNNAIVLADDLLPEVFFNLIGNSSKFGGEDVTITISVEESNGSYQVSVEDTGPGIPDEMKRRLFTRFQNGNSQKSGKGLGLSICKKLIERYGGKIWIEDRILGEPKKGSVIRFTLKKSQNT
jgi:signal transduction histidine kinase